VSVVIVDWLGRAGIAQTTRLWQTMCEANGHPTTVVTRGGRELQGPSVRAPDEGPHPLVTHRRLAQLAAHTIEDLRPDVVIIQNYIVPALEHPLDRALAGGGPTTIVVMHDHHHHSRLAGNQAGLRRRLRKADVVVAHSEYVATRVRAAAGRKDVPVVPLPAPEPAAPGRSRIPRGAERTAISFGVLKRRYKGAQTIHALAAEGVPGWRFAAAGVGAPTDSPDVISFPGYLEAGDLAATVGAADSALMPYRFATQSGAIPFAQAMGAVPVATAIGGLVEQIESGHDGILVPPHAGVGAWRAALELVAAEGPTLAANGRKRVARLGAEFRDRAAALL
jgi:glycosyltransferase involved in cell wall biosynthesis